MASHVAGGHDVATRVRFASQADPDLAARARRRRARGDRRGRRVRGGDRRRQLLADRRLTMADRSEFWIASLALFASGLVLAAPVLGRFGHSAVADAAIALAAACGLGAFLLAGRATLRGARASRRPPPAGPRAAREPEDRRW